MYSRDTIFFYNTCGFTDIMNLTIMRIQETARKMITKDLGKNGDTAMFRVRKAKKWISDISPSPFSFLIGWHEP